MVCRAPPVKGHLHHSAVWPRRQGSRHVFKTQIPRHPSPRTQSLVVNNTQLSHGHSLCQTLKGKQGMTMSHHRHGLKGHSDLQREALPIRRENTEPNFGIKAPNARISCGARRGAVPHWPVRVGTGKEPGLVAERYESSPPAPTVPGSGLQTVSLSP